MPRVVDGKPRESHFSEPDSRSRIVNPARIYSVSQKNRHLDLTQLAEMERAFRAWAEAPTRSDVRCSRKRILFIFLLIRYTGARLNEVLALDLRRNIDTSRSVVVYGHAGDADNARQRQVQISAELVAEIQTTLGNPAFSGNTGSLLKVDAGHVRRKFYERAMECGFTQSLGSPNAIRRARAVELMQNNVPLPVVQRILGHSSPNLTASFVAFSEEDIHQVARHFVERESQRKTSARNEFFGKIKKIRKGDIQSGVELITAGGDIVTAVITNNSLKRLGLKEGSLVTAEVKAPWVVLEKADAEPTCTAENKFNGSVVKVHSGKLTSEFIVRLHDGTEVCSLVTEESRRKLNIRANDNVWIVFSSFAVILHTD